MPVRMERGSSPGEQLARRGDSGRKADGQVLQLSSESQNWPFCMVPVGPDPAGSGAVLIRRTLSRCQDRVRPPGGSAHEKWPPVLGSGLRSTLSLKVKVWVGSCTELGTEQPEPCVQAPDPRPGSGGIRRPPRRV